MAEDKITQTDLDHEGRISTVEEAVKQVLENHIPHIWDAIREIQLWIRGIGIAIALMIVGVIINHFVGK